MAAKKIIEEHGSHFVCEFCNSELADESDWGCCEKSIDEHEKNSANKGLEKI
jgi:hypothetical protein